MRVGDVLHNSQNADIIQLMYHQEIMCKSLENAWENQYFEFHVKGTLNQDRSTLCPTFDVNTPIINPIDLSPYPSSNYN